MDVHSLAGLAHLAKAADALYCTNLQDPSVIANAIEKLVDARDDFREGELPILRGAASILRRVIEEEEKEEER